MNRPLSFELDRWILPTTAARQSIRVAIVGTEGFVHWDPTYDVVARRLSYRPESNWDQGYIFDLQLFDSKTPSQDWGFRSYDGQPLERTGLAEHILFRVGTPEERVTLTPTRATCRDALAVFVSAGCSASNCHRRAGSCTTEDCRSAPRAELELDRAQGIASAIGRVARVTDRGARSGATAVAAQRFGVNMALIEAGEPSLSFILYRMLLGRDAYRNRAGQFLVRPPTTEELERACSWFGVTGEMPPREVGWPADVSPVDLVNTIQRWIGDGATTTDCQ